MKNILWFFVAIIVFIVITLIAFHLQWANATDVVDGDSFYGAYGLEYRLAYIDAPELHQTCHDTNGDIIPLGLEAKTELSSLMALSDTYCIQVDKIDRYKRPIMECRNKESLNLRLVEDGQAVCYWNITKECEAAETAARLAGIGLWRCVDFVQPQEYRKHHPYHRK